MTAALRRNNIFIKVSGKSIEKVNKAPESFHKNDSVSEFSVKFKC